MIARDETQRVRQDREREQSLSTEQQGRSDAESAVALKDEFLAVMAHELRHPLNLIQISVELLARLPELRQVPAVARSAGVIRNAVQSQAKLIDDLLDMSRVRTGKLALALAPLDLAPLVRRAVDAVRSTPGGGELAIAVDTDDAPLPVTADDVRIEQVVMNLLGNAVKFTPPGGTIAVRLGREDGMARIDVTDSGQGIPPDQLPRVFDMYAQPTSVTTRSKGGLGIGLAVVRDIVALHGGRVEAFSEGAGKGARFTVWLPLAESGTIAPDAGPGGTVHDIAGVRILFVDDAEDVVTTCQALLELQGAVVTGATSARQALDILAEADVDVLVAEVAMPEMDGPALLQAVRALPRHARLPAIAIGGLARERDVAEARASGFNAHLGKPLSVERLAAIIRDLLPAREERQA
jgi:two-component system CheB/CheR fusion protein